MARQPAEAARAVNELLQFSDQDQQSLLEVIEEYFTLGTATESDDSDNSDDDMDLTGMNRTRNNNNKLHE